MDINKWDGVIFININRVGRFGVVEWVLKDAMFAIEPHDLVSVFVL